MYLPFERREIEELESYLRARDLFVTTGVRATNFYSLTDLAFSAQEQGFKLCALLDRNLMSRVNALAEGVVVASDKSDTGPVCDGG